jgi:membrane protease YdiL (CAAX protease family)
VFVVGNPYYRIFPTNWNQTFYVALTAFFLIAALVCKRTASLARYWKAVYAFFVASAALVSLKTGLISLHHADMPPMQNLALDKLSQFLLITPVLVLLPLLAKDDLAALFIQKGNLKRGLRFGLIWFIIFGAAALAIQWGTMALSTFIAAIPWILIYIFANAIMEELWFRGIFLRKFGALIGQTGAVVITAVVFGASHINATYEFPGGGIIFGLVVFVLGLAGAHAMFKNDSVIGPILFHAGYDLMIIVPVLNSM